MSVGVLLGNVFDERVKGYAQTLVGALSTVRNLALDTAATEASALPWASMTVSERKAALLQIQSRLWLDDETGQALGALLKAQMRSMLRESRAATVEAFGLGSAPAYTEDDPRIEAICQHAAILWRNRRDLRHSVRVATRLATKEAIDLPALGESLQKAWGLPTEQTYWHSVAAAWTGRARSGGQIHALLDDGIVEGRIEAMIDERTSAICRFLHGKKIALLESEARLSGLTNPDTSTFLDEDEGLTVNEPNLLITDPNGRLFATLEEGADPDGGVFDLGSWKQHITDEELAIVLGPPPYHLLCRSMIVPLDWPDELGMRPDIVYEVTG
jgi:hypothetical protein